MKRRKLLKFFINTFLIIIGLFIIFIVNGIFERSVINKQFEDFKARAEYYMVDPNRPNIHYWRITKENQYDYEDTTRNTFDPNERFPVIGSKADVITGNRNPLENTIVSPIMGVLADEFFLGHSTINSTDDGRRYVEVLGNRFDTPELNVVVESSNSWTSDRKSNIVAGLRIKGTTEEQRNQMVEYARDQIGKGYNYTFLFNRENTYYCTDLVSRAAKAGGININYDFLATTGSDMILSKNTYLFYLREARIVNGNLEYHIYYLEQETTI